MNRSMFARSRLLCAPGATALLACTLSSPVVAHSEGGLWHSGYRFSFEQAA